jgi:hypothetical protein
MAESPYNINSEAFLGSIGKLGKKAGDGIEKFGKRLAKPLAKNEAKQKIVANAAAKAANQAAKKTAKQQEKVDAENARLEAEKKNRRNALRRAENDHKRKLRYTTEFEAHKTAILVERKQKLAEATNAGKPPATPKPPAPSTKPKTPKPAARKTSSGVSTDKDGVLKPINPPKKPTAKTGGALDTKAGEAYND